MNDVEGKVAFVTGGASGIGFGIVRSCLDAGMKVVIGDSSFERLQDAAERLGQGADRAHSVVVDVTDRQAMEQAAAEVVRVFGKVHVLVNNAGVQNPSPLSNMSYEDWDRLMRVNVDGVFNGIHAFLPHMRRHGEGGHVIATSSVLGLITVGENYAAYCASKFAVVAMMEALRAELLGSSIGVSVLCPGPVKTSLEASLKNSELALDPLEVGRLVVRGMCRNDLYILTHPEFSPVIQCRSDAIVAATLADAHPGDGRQALAEETLQRSIYLAECSRHATVPPRSGRL